MVIRGIHYRNLRRVLPTPPLLAVTSADLMTGVLLTLPI